MDDEEVPPRLQEYPGAPYQGLQPGDEERREGWRAMHEQDEARERHEAEEARERHEAEERRERARRAYEHEEQEHGFD